MNVHDQPAGYDTRLDGASPRFLTYLRASRAYPERGYAVGSAERAVEARQRTETALEGDVDDPCQ
jgi:hypothetical protein